MRGYLQEKVTQTAASSKPTPTWVTAHQSWSTWHSLQISQVGECPFQVALLLRASSRQLGLSFFHAVLLLFLLQAAWLCLLAGSLPCYRVFFPAQLVYQLTLLFTYSLGRRNLVNLVSFRDFLKLICLLPVIKSFSEDFHLPLDLLFNLLNILS